MAEFNEDGLELGVSVDFDTLNRVERSRKPAEQSEQAKNLQQQKPEVRRGRPAKAAAADQV